MSDLSPECLDCNRKIIQKTPNVNCPICQYSPICEKCLKLHYVEIHDGEETPPPKEEGYVGNKDDARTVRIMAACNVSYDNMSKILNCEESEVDKYYKFEREQGAEKCTVDIAGKLYEMAMSGNVTAMIFWLSKRSGWKETEGVKDTDVNKIVQGMSAIDIQQRALHMLKGKQSEG